jgi:thiol-disulfide isomerase/thioredoxin
MEAFMSCFHRFGLAALAWLLVACSAVGADDLLPADPFWTLIHDDAVLADLKLSANQRTALRKILDPLDVRGFPLRNKPAAEANEGFAKLAAEARQALDNVLSGQQMQRLEQIGVRSQGTESLLRDEIAAQLKLSEKQRAEIRETVHRTRGDKAKTQKELLAAKVEAAAAEREIGRLNVAQRDAINGLLTAEQKGRLPALLGETFDTSRLGNTRFKAPDLAGDSNAWLNSSPLDQHALRGRVVVIHFFAFGCINCIHNYPTYREWQDELAGKDVQLIGIHTPETKSEHNVETLKSKLQAEQLRFPVVVDNDLTNWNAWGNGMWPSVYILDKQGYLRTFWAGELKWQGATGDQQIRRKIEELLAEK